MREQTSQSVPKQIKTSSIRTRHRFEGLDYSSPNSCNFESPHSRTLQEDLKTIEPIRPCSHERTRIRRIESRQSLGAGSKDLLVSEQRHMPLVSTALGLMCRKRKQSSEPSLSHIKQITTIAYPTQYHTPSRTRALSPPSCRPR